LSTEERLISFPLQVSDLREFETSYHAFISVKPSIGLPDLMEKVLSAVKSELVRVQPKLPLEKASVECLYVIWARNTQDLDVRQLLNIPRQDPDAIMSRLLLIERFGLENSMVGREKGEIGVKRLANMHAGELGVDFLRA
jgi:hypothetical protein